MSYDALKRPHPSRPHNPLIADVCFKDGYIELWGTGTLKIRQACKAAALPEPEMMGQDGGTLVTLFKNRYTESQLRKLGLNDRQVKAVLYMVEKGSITNAKYQELFAISKPTATGDLKELEMKKILVNKGTKGSSSKYELN